MRGEDGDEFVDTLLTWYAENGRHDLPWRRPNAAPFEVLVAELTFQKTSARQVFYVFEDFVKKYPETEAVVDDETDEPPTTRRNSPRRESRSWWRSRTLKTINQRDRPTT